MIYRFKTVSKFQKNMHNKNSLKTYMHIENTLENMPTCLKCLYLGNRNGKWKGKQR